MANSTAAIDIDERRRRQGENEKVEIDFTGPEICKDFLVAFCPHDLFRNTKNDIGSCSLKHDANAKMLYEESARRYKCGFEERFLHRVSEMDRDVRRKIDKNKERLVTIHASYEEETFGKLKESQEEKMNDLLKTIDIKIAEVESMAGECDTTLAQSLVEEANKLKEERRQCENAGHSLMTRFHHLEDVANSLNKPMSVCQICGYFMLVNGAQSRIDDHGSDKIHIAYATIRDILETLPKTMDYMKEIEERTELNRTIVNDLLVAFVTDDKDTVKSIYEIHPLIVSSPTNDTLVYRALEMNAPQCAAFLIPLAAASFKDVKENGVTALTIAIQRGFQDVVKLLTRFYEI